MSRLYRRITVEDKYLPMAVDSVTYNLRLAGSRLETAEFALRAECVQLLRRLQLVVRAAIPAFRLLVFARITFHNSEPLISNRELAGFIWKVCQDKLPISNLTKTQ